MGVTLNNKAMFYTVDALILLVLVLGALFLIEPQPQVQSSVLPTSFVSQDVMKILSDLTLDDINQTWVSQYQSTGQITDTSVTILAQLGEFWSEDNFTLAQELATVALGDLTLEKEFGVWINDEQIYATDRDVEGRLLRSWQIVSGVDKGRPTLGYVSNARARTVTGNQTLIVTISPGGAGWDEGTYTVTSYFNASNYTFYDASFTLSIDSGTKVNDIEVIFNDDNGCRFRRDDIDWLFLGSAGNVGNFTVPLSCIVEDINKIDIEFRNDGANAHTHPGMKFQATYETSEAVQSLSTQFSERKYLYNIESNSIGNDGVGVWVAFPFIIPEDATNVSVGIQIAGVNIRDYVYPDRCRVLYGGAKLNDPCPDFPAWDNTTKPVEDYDYVVFLNNQSPLDVDGSPVANPTYQYTQSELAPFLKNGTNILAVYFNNYLDRVWGNGDVVLYSDPILDPEGSSYVEINYTRGDLANIPFGAIEVNAVKEFGGISDYTKIANFSYPAGVLAGSDAYVHIIERDSNRVRMWANDYTPPVSQHFLSPSDRAVPSDMYVPSNVLDTSPLATNYVKVTDTDVTTDILNTSTIEYFFYLPSFVGFGEVFDNQTAAEEDAQQRLLGLMSPFLTSDDIVQDAQSVQNIPTLWGPVLVEVRSWG